MCMLMYITIIITCVSVIIIIMIYTHGDTYSNDYAIVVNIIIKADIMIHDKEAQMTII